MAGLGADDPTAALAEAYDRYHQRVRVLARRLLADDVAAEDVVQEVFVGLPRASRGYRGSADFESFVLGIAVKRARQHLRAVIRRRRALARLAGNPFADEPPQPERLAYRRQLASHLVRALDQLPAEQRVAFVLCEVEELTAGAAAAIAGVPEPTIRTRCFHARRRLRALLEEEHAE